MADTEQPPPPPPAKRKGGRPRKARGAATSSDAAEARWTVRGVPANVRAIASRGAIARNLTLGDWLSEAIIAYGKGDSQVPTITSEKVVDQLQALTDRLDKLEAERRNSWLTRLFGKS